ncbi:MAG: VanZ family protein [Chthoniobacterales bacterium]
MKARLRHFAVYWLPVVLLMALIFCASTDTMSGEHTSRFLGPFLLWLFPGIGPKALGNAQLLIRKFGHVAEYTALGFLLARGFASLLAKGVRHPAAWAWCMAVAWAALDEFHQAFVPSRTPSPIDVMIDAWGALVGLGIYWALVRWRSKSPRAAAA